MKKSIFKALLALALVLCMAGASWAVYTGTMTANGSGTTITDVVLPGDTNAHTAVYAINATANNAAGKISIFYPTYKTTVDATSSSTTLNVTATTGFSVGDSVVVQTASGLVAERYVSAVNAGVSLTISSALPSGYGVVGSKVYQIAYNATASGTIPVGNATVEKINPYGGVVVGPINSPIVLSLSGSSTSTAINYATWGFKP